jgi:peptidoglycan biosynthesis protein MviN/MurJ (putative lipid II flippase)
MRFSTIQGEIMFKKLSTGYKIASPGLVLAIIFFFMPWVLQSCGNDPMREYSGLQLALGDGADAGKYTGNIFVLLTLIALFVIAFFGIQAAGRGTLNSWDAYGVTGISLVVLIVLFQQFLTAPGEGIQREILYGLWGYIIGWLLILIGGVVNAVEKKK